MQMPPYRETLLAQDKEHDMTRTALLARRTPRSKRALGHRPAATQTDAFVPTSRTELDEATIWVVNAALENGETELAYELADRYQRA